MFDFKRVMSVLSATILLSVVHQNTAHAWSLKKALKDAEHIVTSAPDVVKSIPNPISLQVDILSGKTKPKDILKNEGKKLSDLSNHVREIDNTIHNNINDLADSLGGDIGRIIVETGNSVGRLETEFFLSATNTTGQIMMGQDPAIAIASPLAAAIRDAHNKYDAQAKPLPQEFIEILSPFMPLPVLQRARYSVDNLKISLPSLINAGQEMFGNDHAVTIDDIIVFGSEPDPNDPDDIKWMAHEVHHTYQYMNWGIDQFALNYIKNSSRVESEAEQAANSIYALVMMAGGSADAPLQMGEPFALTTIKTVNTPLGPMQVAVPIAPGNASANGLTDMCVVMGEQIVIGANNAIISPMRFNQVIGQRIPPAFGECVFEMIALNRRYCVSNMNGAVFTQGVQFPIGQCMPL